jgi:hypothetical protein
MQYGTADTGLVGGLKSKLEDFADPGQVHFKRKRCFSSNIAHVLLE